MKSRGAAVFAREIIEYTTHLAFVKCKIQKVAENGEA